MDRAGRAEGRGTKSNYHKERGRETRERTEGKVGKKINLLIFHGQPVIITAFAALGAS